LEYTKTLIKAEITGYRKVDKKTHSMIGNDEPLKPDNLTYWTRATVLKTGQDRSICEQLFEQRLSEADSVHGAAHLLLRAAQIKILCGKGDIKVDCLRADLSIVLFDGRNGGLGVAEAVFEKFEDICIFALQIVENCACISGCPKCVHHGACTQRQAENPLKEGAKLVLRSLVGRWKFLR
jgi:DEAD/DEAH box helicase domain-containing protein